VSFLVSLLLPVLATAVFFYSYPGRAAKGLVPAEPTTAAVLAKGALTGAAALVFLSILGVVILVVRGKPLTPSDIDVSAAVFWAIQFALAAAIGAVVGLATAFALLPWLRDRLAQATPKPPVT
jgi:hypothetical protein